MSCSSAADLAAAEQLQRHRKAEADARILPLFRAPAHGCGEHATKRPQHTGVSSRSRAINGRVMSLARNSAGFVPISPELVPQTLFTRRKFWAERFGIAPVLPTTRAEMDELGWDSAATSSSSPATPTSTTPASAWRWSAACWRRRASASASSLSPTGATPRRSARSAARPSCGASPPATWTRWSTATRRTGGCATTTRTRRAARAGGAPIARVIVYAQRCREAFGDVPVVIGGIEASLRRIAHYDYWSDKVRRSILLDSRADLLVYGNGERAIVEIAHRLAAGEAPEHITRPARHRVLAPARRRGSRAGPRSTRRRSTRPGRSQPPVDPYAMPRERGGACATSAAPARRRRRRRRSCRAPACGRASDRARDGRAHARLRRRSRPIRCCTRTRRASCTSRRTRATRARWCSGTATATSGSTRRRCRCRRRRWTASTSCRTRASRTRATATRRSRRTR